MTAKIGARAQGLLDNATRDEGIEVIEHHLESVMRSSRLWGALERLLRDGEEELEERKLTTQAKALLQQTRGMSEEQAYLYLRTTSRRSRKPIPAIARDLIAGNSPALQAKVQ